MARTISIALSLLCAGVALADDFDPSEAEERPAERWARNELLTSENNLLGQEHFIPILHHHDEEIREGFGSPNPPSNQVLLHYVEGWDSAENPIPVLLVHGAGLTANHCWADRPFEQRGPGLAEVVRRSGRKVFALTFAHPHGDNYMQAEMLSCAIARVLHVTGAEQLDLVAHSKGGMSSRIYLSDAGPRGSTRYRGDVRRYVMLGTPNAGLDVSFAYPNLNYWILEHHAPAPLCWTGAYYNSIWTDFTEQCIYDEGGAFPGQNQMLRRWDGRYGLTRAFGQLDIESTYAGGRGNYSVGRGIDFAIEEGEHCMDQLDRHGVDRGVELAALAGTNPWLMGLVGERRGPCDGLLFVESALALEPLAQDGAPILRKDVRYFNHLQLCYDERANDWVVEVLDLE